MRRAAAVLLTLLAAGTAGCGSDEEIGSAGSGTPAKVQPARAPETTETIEQAADRVAEATSSGDCDRILALVPLSRQAAADPAQCETVRGLAEYEAAGSEAYGGAGVIDFSGNGVAPLTGIFIVDGDGLYHLAFIDTARGEPSAGTPFTPGFDAAARDTVEALREGDCSAFAEVLSPTYGPQGDVADQCTYLSNEPLADLLASHPDTEPERLGGNGNHAFYAIRAPEATYTLILVREPGAAGEPPDYRFVSAYPTGTATVDTASPLESVDEAVDRIDQRLASPDCDDVYSLSVSSRRPASDLPAVCEGYRALEPLSPADAESFPGGGVIDYTEGELHAATAVLVLDADGRYHLGFVDPFTAESSVGTPFDPRFDAAARNALDALRDRDCAAFREVASGRYGPGTGEGACLYVENNPLTPLLQTTPQAGAERLGGNGDYAFYEVAGRDAAYVMVLAREPDEVKPGVPALPAGAPEYGYVDTFATTTRLPPSGD